MKERNQYDPVRFGSFDEWSKKFCSDHKIRRLNRQSYWYQITESLWNKVRTYRLTEVWNEKEKH